MKTGNTRRDAGSYGRTGCKRGTTLADGNELYEAFLRARRGSSWKDSVQHMEMNLLPVLARLRRDLINRTYRPKTPVTFTLRERGRTRSIHGDLIEDRTVKHALCDGYLMPAVLPRLIYDNGVSQRSKGVDFARKRLVAHLSRYYREHGSNDGYILLGDCSKYYDNLRHDIVREMYADIVEDDLARWVVDRVLDSHAPDVSYMSDEEFQSAMDTVFDSLEHDRRKEENPSGEKILRKHMDIGDLVSMVTGIAYTIPIDDYIKTVRGERYFGRYQDDFYLISDSRDHLEEMKREITERSARLGITINQRKTKICRLSESWRYLQVQYSLSETGRIVRKINPWTVTRERRRLKKMAGHINLNDFRHRFKSWYRAHRDYMSRRQRQNICRLRDELEAIYYVQDNPERRNDHRGSYTERE